MSPLHHREPGLAGLIGDPLHRPYYSLIADGIHLHPSVLRIAYRADPGRCILVTDSIELAGLPDGIYPGNGQIVGRQRKVGDRVTLVRDDGGEEEEEVLIGSCCSLHTCILNMVELAGCSLAEAVMCATENVAGLMEERARGVLEPGRRADFVIMEPGPGARVRETWVAGVRVYER